MITNAAHLHLVLNHLPIFGTLFALCLLLAGLGLRDRSLKRAGLVTLILIALATPGVYLSGEAAEETVEKLPGFLETYIEKHEELAKIALLFTSASGVLSALSLLKGESRKLVALTLLWGLLTFTVLGLVGNSGGKIRHSEIRGEQPPAYEVE